MESPHLKTEDGQQVEASAPQSSHSVTRENHNSPSQVDVKIEGLEEEEKQEEAAAIGTSEPTETEFSDPYALVQRLRSQTCRGAVRIIPPSGWAPGQSELDLELALPAQVSISRDAGREQFYKNIVRFHHKTSPIVRLPSIDKKPIDLHALRKCVLAKGGFDEVCRRKQWAQIGRELGYASRAMTSLSTSLKIAYSKVIKAYDEHHHNGDAPSDEKNSDNKRPMDTAHSSVKKCTYEGVAHITNSRLVCRPVNVLRSKGLQTHFDSWSTEKPGITAPDTATHPLYDFKFWHRGKEVLDYPLDNGDISRTTFKKLAQQSEPAHDDSEFWDQLHHHQSHIPLILGQESLSVFPSLNELSNSDPVLVSHPWNLHNLPLNKDGLLRYLPDENLASPKLSVGDKFSVTSYACEDHQAYLCNYLHTGASKVWYFIDPEDRTKYETLLQELSSSSESQSADLSDLDISDALKRDIMDALGEQSSIERRAELSSCTWDTPLKRSCLNQNLVVSPRYLHERGIKCHSIIQHPGELIVKFPGSYSMTISLGVHISESVAFLPHDWIDLDKSTLNTLPSFSYFQLLANIVEESRYPQLLRRVSPHLDALIDEELALRSELKANIPQMKIVNNKFDYIADDDLKCTLPTKIVVKSQNSVPFIFSSRSDVLKDLPHSQLKYELHVFYSDDKLRAIQKSMLALAQTPEEWIEKFESLLAIDSKPQLKALKYLYAESEHILSDIPEAHTLSEYLQTADEWIERAQGLLNAKQKNRIRNRKMSKTEEAEEKMQFDIQDLQALVKTIPQLNFSCPEIDQILELASEIITFEKSVRTFLSDEGHSIEHFMDMIDLGRSFGIRSKSLAVLEKIVKRLEWLEQYDVMLQSQRLEDLEAYLREGTKVCGTLDQTRLRQMELLVETGRQWCKRVIADLETPGMQFEQISATLKSLENVPLYEPIVGKLQEIKQTHNLSVEKVYEIFTSINANSELLQSLKTQRMLRGYHDPNFDAEVYHQLLSKFSGGDNDPRPLYSAVREVVDRSKEFQPTEHSALLESHLKQAEEWWRRMKKLFGKINSPFAMMKQHLSDLRDKNALAFNLNDVYVKDLPEEKHLTYCFCRRLESGVMIACERCEEWYHCKCLKFGRGKSKQLENYMCPVCDFSSPVPREFHCPKLEDVRDVVEDGSFSELNPDHLDVLTDIWRDASKFKDFLHNELMWEDGEIVETNVAKVRFYLRKLEGAAVLLLDEYNQLKQLAWKLDPCCDGPPPLVDSSKKTQKRKPKVVADVVLQSTPDVALATTQMIATTSLDVQSAVGGASETTINPSVGSTADLLIDSSNGTADTSIDAKSVMPGDKFEPVNRLVTGAEGPSALSKVDVTAEAAAAAEPSVSNMGKPVDVTSTPADSIDSLADPTGVKPVEPEDRKPTVGAPDQHAVDTSDGTTVSISTDTPVLDPVVIGEDQIDTLPMTTGDKPVQSLEEVKLTEEWEMMNGHSPTLHNGQ